MYHTLANTGEGFLKRGKELALEFVLDREKLKARTPDTNATFKLMAANHLAIQCKIRVNATATHPLRPGEKAVDAVVVASVLEILKVSKLKNQLRHERKPEMEALVSPRRLQKVAAGSGMIGRGAKARFGRSRCMPAALAHIRIRF